MSIQNFFGDALRLEDTKFLFVFCPNNSGTTVISQYLTAQLGGYLPPFGHNEGQMMPEVRDMMRTKPWNAAHAFDWAFIRAQWETLVSDEIFVEASPPNLMRVGQIEPVFGRDSSALISICDPYQHIASSMRRYAAQPEKIAKDWVLKAKAIRKIRKDYPHFPFVSYERFVKNPRIINKKLGVPVRDVTIEGKRGSDIDGISSAYVRSVGFLTADDVAAVTRVLEKAPGLFKFFGYRLAGQDFFDVARDSNPEEFRIGVARRRHWDQQQIAAREAADR